MAKKKKVRVRLVRSYIGRKPDQRKTAMALGLRKINQYKDVELSPSMQGMIDRISHLVKVEEIG
jgi:large subunit ribosomal protein L30